MKNHFLSLLSSLALMVLLTPTPLAASPAEVIPCQYADADDFSEGLAAVEVNMGRSYRWGFINKAGQEVIPFQYEDVSGFHEGLAAVEVDDRWGFIDQSGHLVIPCRYNDAGDFHDGLAAVKINNRWGFIDQSGQMVIPCQYYNVKDFSEGLAAVSTSYYPDGKWGFIDQTGKEIVPCQYHVVKDFSEGLAAVGSREYNSNLIIEHWGFIDKTGKEILPLIYGDVGNFSQGLAMVYRYPYYDSAGNLILVCGFVDTSGKTVIPCQYYEAGYFSQDLASFSRLDGNGYGYLDKTGATVIAPQYYSAQAFSQGLAAVERNTGRYYQWGYIDQTGKEVVPCRYDYAADVSDGMARVRLNGKWGFLSLGASPDLSAVSDAAVAYASNQRVELDGRQVELPCYALKDTQGNATNYIRLRDLAILLNGSAAQFQVDWGNVVTITTRHAYTPNGSELSTPYSGNRIWENSAETTLVDGQVVSLSAFVLKDDSGGGYTYYQLRDLGRALGFNVGWQKDRGLFLETDKFYNEKD